MSEEIIRSKYPSFYPFIRMGVFFFEMVSVDTIVLCRKDYTYHDQYSTYVSNLYMKRTSTGWAIYIKTSFETVKDGERDIKDELNYDINATELLEHAFPFYDENIVLNKNNEHVKLLENLSKKYSKKYYNYTKNLANFLAHTNQL